MDDAPPPAATTSLAERVTQRALAETRRLHPGITLVIEDPVVFRVPLGDEPSLVIGVPPTFTPDDAEALVALLRDQQAAERHCATCDCG